MQKAHAINLHTMTVGFLANCPINCFFRSLLLMLCTNFVAVVYEDISGVQKPIGLIHKIRVDGKDREVFTFCCANETQSDKAFFVRRRKGNKASDVALSFDDQQLIPSYLRQVPDSYKRRHFEKLSPVG